MSGIEQLTQAKGATGAMLVPVYDTALKKPRSLTLAKLLALVPALGSATNDAANVNLFLMAGEADATSMFNRATAAARRIYVPAGTYVLTSANWPSNTEIFGDGDGTVLSMPAAASELFLVNSGSAAVANNIVNLRMRKLQLRATCDVDGFSEQKHLLRLNGVSNVLFEDVLFRGFRGDGAYIGSGDAGQERHNENVVFRRCRFDGINRTNRNAISFIDIDGALVEGCEFKNCTAPTMPGPIDLEPDANSFAIIKNVTIRRNKFSANGGNSAEVSLLVPSAVTVGPTNITVENNASIGYVGTGAFFVANSNRAPTATSDENDYKVIRNKVSGHYRPFHLIDGKRVTLEGNTWSDCTHGALIGYTGATNAVRDVSVVRDRFVRCGTVDRIGLSVFTADYLTFSGSAWIDCGSGEAGSYAIDFNAGSSSHVYFDGVDILTPTGKTLVAIQKEATHTFNGPTNRLSNTNVNSLTNNFQTT